MRIEEQIIFPVAADAFWPWISTPERLAEWITDVQRFEARPPGALKAGSLLVAHPPHGAPIEARVERVEPGRLLALRARGLPNDLDVLLTLEIREQGARSVLILLAETELSGILVFAEKMIASKVRAKLAAWTGTLRQRIEAPREA